MASSPRSQQQDSASVVVLRSERARAHVFPCVNVLHIFCSVPLPCDPKGQFGAAAAEVDARASDTEPLFQAPTTIQQALPVKCRQRHVLLATSEKAMTYKQMKEAVKGIRGQTMSTARGSYGMNVSGMEVSVLIRSVAWYNQDAVERVLRYTCFPRRSSRRFRGRQIPSRSMDGKLCIPYLFERESKSI